MPVTLGNTSITSSSGTLNVVDTLHVHNSSETGYATNAATSLSRATLSLRPHATDSPRILFGSLDTSVNNAIAGSAYIQRGNGTSAWDLHLQPFGGRVLMPNQPAFSAKLALSRVITNNAVINFDSVVFNTGNHYNGSTGLFTAPVTGRYLFNAHTLRNTGGSGHVFLAVRINGSNANITYGQVFNYFGGHETQLSGSWLVSLNANDTAGIYYNTASGNINFFSGEAFLNGYLIG